MKRMIAAGLVLLCLGTAWGEAEGFMGFLSGLFGNDRAYVVGTDIPFGDITDFYYTYDATTFPPEYQRYRFYLEDGSPMFFHETRAGDHWPLTEADAILTGTSALSEDAWGSFLECVKGGTVKAREEDVTAGDPGPWMFLYWKGDRDRIQVFEFASQEAQATFVALCEGMVS